MKPAAMSLLVVILLVIPGTALAKVPWHSVEFVPASPVAGEPLTVVVRFWDDPAHTQPSTWSPDATLGGVLEFVGPTGRVPLALARIGDAAFQGEITLGEGTWRLVITQRFAGATGPTEVELAIVTVAAALSATAPIGAAVIGVALLMAGVIVRGRRSASPGEAG
jgi:hypothetical protein